MNLYVIDATGAAFSAFTIGIVLRVWLPVTGLPDEALLLLASFPVLFAFTGLLFYFRGDKQKGTGLKVLSYFNASYVVLSTTVLIIHFETVQWPGWIYFISEILIVAVLARIEYVKSQQSANV